MTQRWVEAVKTGSERRDKDAAASSDVSMEHLPVTHRNDIFCDTIFHFPMFH